MGIIGSGCVGILGSEVCRGSWQWAVGLLEVGCVGILGSGCVGILSSGVCRDS